MSFVGQPSSEVATTDNLDLRLDDITGFKVLGGSGCLLTGGRVGVVRAVEDQECPL